MDSSCPAPQNGVVSLISMFEVLTTTTSVAAPPYTVFPRSHRRWRYSCPAIDIPRSFDRQHSFPGDYHTQDIFDQLKHRDSIISPNATSLVQQPTRAVEDRGTILATQANHHGDGTLAASAGSDCSTNLVLKPSKDGSTVLERRKVFETSHIGRPQTSGGERYTQTSEFQLVSTHPAPTVPLQRLKEGPSYLELLLMDDRPNDAPLKSSIDYHLPTAPSARRGRGPSTVYRNTSVDQFCLANTQSPPKPHHDDSISTLASSRSPKDMAIVRKTQDATSLPLISKANGPIRVAYAPKLRQSDSHGSVSHLSNLSSAAVSLLPIQHDGCDQVISGKRRGVGVVKVVPETVPDTYRNRPPRHVSVPEWYDETILETTSLPKAYTLRQPLHSPLESIRSETYNASDLSRSEASTGSPIFGRVSPTKTQAHMQHRIHSSCASPRSSPLSENGERSHKAYSGSVQHLKNLFDVPAQTSHSFQQMPQKNRTTYAPQGSGIMSPCRPAPALLDTPSPQSLLYTEGPVKSTMARPSSDCVSSTWSPLRVKIGRFECMEQSSRPLCKSPDDPARIHGDRNYASDAILRFKEPQSSRKARGLKSWKRLHSFWPQYGGDKTSQSRPQRKEHRPSPKSVELSVIETSYHTPEGQRPSMLMGSRPLLKGVAVPSSRPRAHDVWALEKSALMLSSTVPDESRATMGGNSHYAHFSHTDRASSDKGSIYDDKSHGQRNIIVPHNHTPSLVIRRSMPDVVDIEPASFGRKFTTINNKASRHGHTSRIVWGRRQVSTNKKTVVSNVHCGLQHPKPMRSYDTSRLVSLCRDQSIALKASIPDI